MRKRKVNHRKEEARAYDPITQKEYREILDKYLSGMSYEEIAQEMDREEAAIRLLITSKIPMNYDEGGKRKPAIERLLEKKSSLVSSRRVTRRDTEYFKKLKRRGRSLSECCLILNLDMEGLQQMQTEYGLPQKKGGYW